MSVREDQGYRRDHPKRTGPLCDDRDLREIPCQLCNATPFSSQGKLGVPGLPGYPGRQGPKVMYDGTSLASSPPCALSPVCHLSGDSHDKTVSRSPSLSVLPVCSPCVHLAGSEGGDGQLVERFRERDKANPSHGPYLRVLGACGPLRGFVYGFPHPELMTDTFPGSDSPWRFEGYLHITGCKRKTGPFS